MTPLYRYLSEKRLDTFLSKGELLFRSLSYFRDYEDQQTRGDEFEGVRVFRPNQGLQISNLSTNDQFSIPHTFESVVDQDNIFVFCMSTRLSPEIAEKFQAEACIEIFEPERFLAKVRARIPPIHKIQAKRLVHGPVSYYKRQEPPMAEWALPDRIALSKLEAFEWQHEYRITFATQGAFDVGKVKVDLVASGERLQTRLEGHPSRKLLAGSLHKFCKVHRFPRVGLTSR